MKNMMGGDGELDPMKLMAAMQGQGGKGGADMAQLMGMLGGGLEAGASSIDKKDAQQIDTGEEATLERTKPTSTNAQNSLQP